MLELQSSHFLSSQAPCLPLLISEKHFLWQQVTPLSLFHSIALFPPCPNCLHTDTCCGVPVLSTFPLGAFPWCPFTYYFLFITSVSYQFGFLCPCTPLFLFHYFSSCMVMLLCHVLTWSGFLSSSIVLLLVSQILCFLGISLVVTIVVIIIFFFISLNKYLKIFLSSFKAFILPSISLY